jgi:hypothetical protein
VQHGHNAVFCHFGDMAGLERDQTSAFGESQIERVDADRLDPRVPQGIDDRSVQARDGGMCMVDAGQVLRGEAVVDAVTPGLGVPARPCTMDEHECGRSPYGELAGNLVQAGVIDSAFSRFVGDHAPSQFQYHGLSHVSLFSRRPCLSW